MELLPIFEHIVENAHFANHPDCQETLYPTVVYYTKVGFRMPWICYYARANNRLVGSGAFKGKPMHGRVEIAYAVFPACQRQGHGTAICGALVALARATDPTVRITARTLPHESFSTSILRKNYFVFHSVVNDEDDGEVWEWWYEGA